MAETKTMTKDLTGGNMTKTLLKYAAPLFVANALQAIYNVVDMIVVGQVELGPGMSGVSIGGEVLHVMTFLIMGFTGAGQVIISQFVGAGRKDKITKMIGTMFTLTFIFSIVLGVAGIVFSEPLLRLLNTPPEAFQLAKDYLITCLCGILFISGYNTICGILRGMGDSKHPFIFIGIAAVLNTILDVLFVAVFRWSTFGAALATVIGQSVSFFAAYIYLYKHREAFGFDFKFKSFRIYKDVVTPLVKLGIPMSIQSAAIMFSKTLLSAWINDCGVIYSSLAAIFNKLTMFMGIVTNSFNTAGGAMIGQCIGARKYERVPKAMTLCLVLTGIVCVICGIIVGIFPNEVFSLFTPDEGVLAASSILILPMEISFLGGVCRSFAFPLINGSGNAKLNLIVAMIDGIIARIGFAYLLGFTFNMSCKGFWLGDGIAGCMPFLIGLVFLISGKWKKSEAVEQLDN